MTPSFRRDLNVGTTWSLPEWSAGPQGDEQAVRHARHARACPPRAGVVDDHRSGRRFSQGAAIVGLPFVGKKEGFVGWRALRVPACAASWVCDRSGPQATSQRVVALIAEAA